MYFDDVSSIFFSKLLKAELRVPHMFLYFIVSETYKYLESYANVTDKLTEELLGYFIRVPLGAHLNYF